MKIKLIDLTVILALTLAACAPAVTQPTSTAAMPSEPKATESMDNITDNSESMESPHATTPLSDSMKTEDSAIMESPTWFDTAFTNVNSGETFKISDFKGKVVLVETMATWCSNCLKQQNQVKALHELLGDMNADLISVGIGVDVNEDSDMLKNYVQKQGFDWFYSIASTETAREISQLYGAQFLNPPSTPILLVDRKGEVHILPFGIKDAATLKEAIQPLLEENM